jgi:hypothetical protein
LMPRRVLTMRTLLTKNPQPCLFKGRLEV